VTSPFEDLRAVFRSEHGESTPAEVRAFADEIVRRHGSGVAAVFFYGSCLRKGNLAGSVLDFYAVVDSYRSCYRSRTLALANGILPPNVFLLSIRVGDGELHSKYAVISAADFARGVTGRTLNAIVWGRFCQPSRVIWARDETTRDALASACAEAAVTMMRAALAVDPSPGLRTVDPERLWHAGFRSTYATELRTERPETILGLFAAAPERYVTVGALALRELAARGEVGFVDAIDRPWEVRVPPAWLERNARSRRVRTPIAKAVYLVRLIKSALTFGDWLPYALFKLGRHTGVQIEPTPLQRRFPLIFGWPVLLKLLLSQKIR
jgi:hypothetical protein